MLDTVCVIVKEPMYIYLKWTHLMEALEMHPELRKGRKGIKSQITNYIIL